MTKNRTHKNVKNSYTHSRPRRIRLQKILGITVGPPSTLIPFSGEMGYINSKLTGSFNFICTLTEEQGEKIISALATTTVVRMIPPVCLRSFAAS